MVAISQRDVRAWVAELSGLGLAPAHLVVSPAAFGLMTTFVRDWWRATTWTASRSHVWMMTSPAKLLMDSRVPFCTGMVSSVFGAS